MYLINMKINKVQLAKKGFIAGCIAGPSIGCILLSQPKQLEKKEEAKLIPIPTLGGEDSKEKQKLKRQLDMKDLLIKDFSQSNEKLYNELSKRSERYEDKLSMKDKLLTQFAKDSESLYRQITRLQEKLAFKDKLIEIFVQNAKSLHERNETLTKEKNDLNKELSETKEESDSLREELVTLKGNAEAASKSASSKLTQTEIARDHFRDKSSNQEGMLKSLFDSIGQMIISDEAKATAGEYNSRTYEGIIKNLQNLIDKKNKELSDEKSKLENLKRVSLEEIEKLDQKLQSLTNFYQATDEELDETKSLLDKARSNNSELSKVLDEILSEVEKLQEKISDLETLNTALKHTANTANERVKRQNSELQALKNENFLFKNNSPLSEENPQVAQRDCKYSGDGSNPSLTCTQSLYTGSGIWDTFQTTISRRNDLSGSSWLSYFIKKYNIQKS